MAGGGEDGDPASWALAGGVRRVNASSGASSIEVVTSVAILCVAELSEAIVMW